MSIERDILKAAVIALEDAHFNSERKQDVHLRSSVIKQLKDLLAQGEQPEKNPMAIDGNTSDGYHTFKELYEFRKAYNAALFNEWTSNGKYKVHKSWRHHNGELCFGGGWFIVVAVVPRGQISNHYEAKDWDLFSVPETREALFEFDGHTGADVVERLKLLAQPEQKTIDLNVVAPYVVRPTVYPGEWLE